MDSMKRTKRCKNKNASVPENVTAVSGSMWFAGVTITVGIGAAAFILSFLALRDLCIQAGQPREIAFLFPVIVDGTILQATMGVVSRRHDHRARRFFWKILIGAATVSCQWPIRSAHGRPAEMPAGGHENCPVMANRSAHQGFGGVGHEAAELG